MITLLLTIALAGARPAAFADTIRPSIEAARAAQRPRIDGRLNDAVWQTATPVSGFTQVEPRDGAAPAERTEVRVAYDQDALYIAARLYSANASSIVARLGRRDAQTNSDGFVVAIDSYHDHRTSFRLGVNAAGIKSDAMTSNDAPNGDDSWDPVWDAATQIDAQGWTVEIAIPLSQLRFANAERPTWGINFERFTAATGELDRWSWSPNSESGYASRFGHLIGMVGVGVAATRRLELLPYAVTQADYDTVVNRANPFNDGRTGRASMGADFKYGLSSALTLTGTINPDFGQVEADPAEVNLSIYETYFNERRPFFVEGANLFSFGVAERGSIFGAPQLFYSRRIGRPPSRVAPREALFADVPEVTHILGATKLSGQIGGWSLGVLDAVTAREEARIQTASLVSRSIEVEPLTNYGVLSLRRSLRGGQSGLGFFGTTVDRKIDTTALSFLRSSAQSAGLDFYHLFGGNRFGVNGTASLSRVRGDSLAMALTQKSPLRYSQRPDQDYMKIDPSARSMSGSNFSLSAGKITGRWLIGSDFFTTSPGYEINDAGFLSESDRTFLGFRTSYRWLKPTGPFRFAQLSATQSQQWNYGGTRVFGGVYSGFYGQLRNYWSVNLSGTTSRAALNDRVTRGGPLVVIPPQWSANLDVTTDSRRSMTAEVYGSLTRNESGGYANYAQLSLAVRPTSALAITFAPSFNETHSAAGYVGSYADNTAQLMYGRRYVAADLEQKSIDLTLRTDLALTSTLSMQFYAQPFVSSVDYEGFKSFARASAFEFLVYGRERRSTITYDEDTHVYTVDADGPGPAPSAQFPNPDFRLRSLRANLVLRWDYRAGSTLYLAWAHGRATFEDLPRLDLARDFRDLFHDEQRNRLLVKVSYWINP